MPGQRGAALFTLFVLFAACGDGAMMPNDGGIRADADLELADDAATPDAGSECPPGTAGPDCEPCATGTHCPGGEAPSAECADGSWDHDEDPATVCSPWSDCEAGTWVTAPGTSSTDRECEPCGEGEFSSSVNAAECTPWTTCSAGTHVDSPASASSDRTCLDCSVGTFSATTNAAECSTWTQCVPGELIESEGSSTEDRVCSPCPDGTFSSEPNSSACVPHGSCPAGTQETAPGDDTDPPTCETCDPGSFCPGGGSRPVACEAGTFDHDASAASECVAWSNCAPGEYVSSGGTNLADRSCTPCGPESFSDSTNAAACDEWTDCPVGTAIDSPGTALADRTCTACDTGEFSDTVNSTTCTAWDDCEPGSYVSAPATSTTDRECSACASGTFTSTQNASSCATWASCAPGEYVSTPGSTSTDQVCATCSMGSYSTTTDAPMCAPWTECRPGESETTPGSATQDRTCTATEDCLAALGVPCPDVLETYVKASNTGTNDRFGVSLARSGDTLVVGAPVEASNATGVNGDQSDDSALRAGAVYVFVRDASGWSQQAYLKASNAEASDNFGVAVAISGDTLVVGAQHEDSGAAGVGGNQSSNAREDAGAAYVFHRVGGVWSQQAYLKAPTAYELAQFGAAVAISGDRIAVGAQREVRPGSSVVGAVYTFIRTAGTWAPDTTLRIDDVSSRLFGNAVAMDADTLVVAARDQYDAAFRGVGAVHVYRLVGGAWSYEALIQPPQLDGGDDFGWSVSLSGDSLAVGAPREDGGSAGIDGDESNDDATDSGAAYVFTRGPGGWSQAAYIKASNSAAYDRFGVSVALDGSRLAVGAEYEDSPAILIDGDQESDAAPNSGAAYLFSYSIAAASWQQDAYVKATNTQAGDRFGDGLLLDGSSLAVAASHEDSGAVGIDGDQTSNSAASSGALYLYRIAP
jgi:hypothetical protein